MRKGRPNRSGVDWSDPAAVATYKRGSERHHEYNREYMRENHPYVPTGNRRGQRGETHGMAKLDWRAVRWMRARYERANITYTRIRAVLQRAGYHVALSTVSEAIKGKWWKEES